MTQDEKNARMEEWKRTVIVPIMQGLLASGRYTYKFDGSFIIDGETEDGRPLVIRDAIKLAVSLESEIETLREKNRQRANSTAKP